MAIFVNTIAFCAIISFEAEDANNLNHTTIYNDSSSWGYAYIDVGSLTNISSHAFYIPTSGNYNVWLRLKSSSADVDSSLILAVNGAEYVISVSGASWKWINEDTLLQKICLSFPKGKNIITVQANPDPLYEPACIDSIAITDYLNYVPSKIPPNISLDNWEQVVSNGFGDTKNHEAKMMDVNGSLYVSTSNTNLHPAIYKTDDGVNFQKVYELKTPYGNGYYMYRILDFKYLDLGVNSGLYAISDDWYGTCYLTKLNSDNTFTTIGFGNRDWWTKDIASLNGFAYAGFYNDWNLWFTMRRTQDPMAKTTWLNVSESAFGKDPATNKQYANMDTDASAVFKGYLYIGTYNYGYFGRTTSGAQIWRTSDGTTWQQVVGNGFGSVNRSSISHMTVFGGYLYATTAEAFGSNYIYRTKDGISWELAFQGMSSEPYFGDITSYMGRLYLTTYNWGGRVYSSADGKIWAPVSNPYINNNSQNSLVGDLHPFKNSLYVNTRNMISGTNIFRGKLFKDPALNSIGNKSIYEGQNLDFTISAIGEPLLSYSASNLPVGATFNSEAQKFSWEPSYGQAGIYSNVKFEVVDGLDNQVFKNISIEVLKTVIHGDILEENRNGGMVGVEGVTAQLFDETKTNILEEVTSDSNGHFNIFKETWPTGIYFIKLLKPGYEDKFYEINIQNNSSEAVNAEVVSYPFVELTSPLDGAVIDIEP